jgi:hypothetical protein
MCFWQRVIVELNPLDTLRFGGREEKDGSPNVAEVELLTCFAEFGITGTG